MLICSARLSRPVRITASVLCGALVLAGLFLASAPRSPVRTNAQRVSYLAKLGWEVDPEPVSTEVLSLPLEFGEAYQPYLALQAAQDYELAHCAGKEVTRYTYAILNAPPGEEWLAGLLVFRGRVVGGDLLSAGSGGFLRGLRSTGETEEPPALYRDRAGGKGPHNTQNVSVQR